MELQIDTSLLNKSNKLLYKIEESTLNELKEFTLNSINHDINQFLNVRENYLIKVDYFLIEKFSQLGLVLFGEIVQNNQTVFDCKNSDRVFVYIKNPNIIKNILTRIIFQKMSQILLEIEECSIIKYSKFDSSNKNLIFYIMSHLPSILKTFFSMKKFKFNKWENILISSKFFQESYLLEKILKIIGYSVTVHPRNSLEILADNIFENSAVLSDSLEESNTSYFDFVIETSSYFYENKLKYFNLLKNEGNLVLISVDQEINSNYDPNKIQFDPRDFEVMYKKSLGLNICNLKSLMKFTLSKGRELNFVNEMIDKLLTSEGTVNISESEWERFVERLQIKIYDKSNIFEKSKDKMLEEIINSSINISFFILNIIQ